MRKTNNSRLTFYAWMSRFGVLNYRMKIMAWAFIGTHVPLIVLAVFLASRTSPDWSAFVTTVGVTLVATLAGTAVTLLVLNELLKPVTLTSTALRTYRETRDIVDLPRGFSDEVGRLMADAGATMEHLERALDALEHVDETTGLPNRKRFLQVLDAHGARGEPFAVAIVRFENYDRIAETVDLRTAEAAVREIAERLAASPETVGGLARVGTAEFAYIRRPASGDSETTAPEALRRLVDEASGNLAVGDVDVRPALQGGLAAYPDDADIAESLLDNAITAAAQSGQVVTLYSPAARERALERFRMEQDLRRALDENEFELHFQPVVDIGSRRVAGAEALVRWRHPSHGLIAPGVFIPVAESSGLIDPMGRWIMRQACATLAGWSERGRDDLTMAINISMRQFSDPDLSRHLAEAMQAASIDPSRLEIELTETAAMADHEHTARVFAMLRDLGVSIAIDDFGTGYASMSYLRKLPFDKLKIDREFVDGVDRNAASQAICSAMIELSRGLGLKVLAEGAETEEEVRFLAQRGCDLFQGFYFARPQPESQFEAAVDAMRLRWTLEDAKPENGLQTELDLPAGEAG